MAFDNTRGSLTAATAGVRRQLVGGVNIAVAAALAATLACASASTRPPVGTADPDRFLYERGTAELNDKDWFTAREYFRQLVESYPQSPFRGDAKLGVGDTYMGEGTTEGYVLALNEYREFLSFYPTHRRADYAQFKLAMAHFYQMRGAMRDQTETLEAIKELTTFLEKFPSVERSPLFPEAQAKLREAKDRLGDHELGVGVQYHRSRWYPGAIDRLKNLIEKDPQFTRRDAALFYLADSFDKLGRAAEALPYFDRLIKEFEQSEFIEKAQLRVTAIRAQMEKKSGD